MILIYLATHKVFKNGEGNLERTLVCTNVTTISPQTGNNWYQLFTNGGDEKLRLTFYPMACPSPRLRPSKVSLAWHLVYLITEEYLLGLSPTVGPRHYQVTPLPRGHLGIWGPESHSGGFTFEDYSQAGNFSYISPSWSSSNQGLEYSYIVHQGSQKSKRKVKV